MASACSLLAPTDQELMGGREGVSLVGNGGAGAGGAGNAGAGVGGVAAGGAPTGGAPTGGAPDVPDPDPAPKTPALEDLSLWLRADDGVSTTSSRLTSWESPMMGAFPAYAVAPDTVDGAPSLGPLTLAGRVLPTFDGVDDGLQSPDDHDFTTSTGYGFFVVLVPTDVDSEGEILSIGGQPPLRLGLWKAGQAVEFGTNDPATPRLVTENVFPTENPVMFEVIGTREPSGDFVISTYVNGVARATGASPTWDPDREGSFNISSFSPQSSGFAGGIAEVLIYNSALDEAARFGTEAYLQAKWGCCK